MGRLTDTVALVTGASSGIGEATARTLAGEGAAVALVARRRERLQALADDITGAGGTALVLEADVADAAQATAAVDRAAEHLGRLDVVVNNAGLMLSGPIADAPEGEWERMIDVNLHGVLNVTRAAIPHLKAAAQREPRRVADLINVSSTAGRVARPGTAVYSLTKFGVGAFTEGLRQELLQARVRVAVVEPGTVATELIQQVRDGPREAMTEMIGDMELLQPQDIADTIAFMVTRDRRVAVNEVLVRAAEQTW